MSTDQDDSINMLQQDLDLVQHPCATLGLLFNKVLALAGLGLGLDSHDARKHSFL